MALRSGRVGIHPSQVDPITGMLLGGPTPGSVSFEDLSDAQITNPEAGQTLIYNGTGWENEFSSILPTTLAALQDVQITDPADGDYLTYDSVNSKWINSGEAPAPAYTDLTVTMYGAVEDTISFTDAAGITHSEVFASGQSSKSVTFKINYSGATSITFTSAVAKDPDNLSNDFTKTVSITNETTSIYVMPDNTFYWYGCQIEPWDTTTLVFVGNGSWTNTPMAFNTNNMSQSLSGTLKTTNASISKKVSFDGKLTAILSCSISNSGAIQKVQATSKTVSDKYMSITADLRGSGYNSSDVSCCFSSTSGTTDGSDSAYLLGSLSGSSMTTTIYALWYE